MNVFFLSLMAMFLWGCSPDYGVELDKGGLDQTEVSDSDDETGDSDDESGETVSGTESNDTGETEDPEDTGDPEDTDDQEDFGEYEGAIIRIVDPPSGSFLPYGEDYAYEAVILTPEGDSIEFNEINWASDLDEAWLPEGSSFVDDTIDVGSHNITATATLPDGSRIAHTVGGVLVQHEDAGTYVGDMIINVDVEVEGVPVGTSCIGAAILVVDAYGETAEGSSDCTLDVLGYFSFEVAHTFEYELDENALDGNAFIAIPFLGSGIPFPSEGEIDSGQLVSDWVGGFPGFADIAGTLDVNRLTREITAL